MTIIDDIKAQIDLSVLVSETASVKLKKSGRGWVGFCPFHDDRHKPSLVVYAPNAKGGWYWKCFYCNEGGSQIDWLLKKNPGWDATEAIKNLATRAGIDLRVGDASIPERVAAQKKRSALRIAMDVFRRWLLGTYQDGKISKAGDAAALSYALDRGWTMGTIENGGLLGFSGRATAEEYKEMRGEFQMNGIDLLSPEAVMILGFKGNVEEWAKARGLDPKAFSDNYISGFMDMPGLVYAHKFDGKIEYLSMRILPGFDEKRKSHNPNAGLIGDRRAFRNSLYRHHHLEGQEKGALLYVVEGQGDAKTFEMVGLPAVALCGSAWEYLVESGEIDDWLNDYEELIYVTDADEAGEKVVTGKKNDYGMMKALGAMLWVGRTPKKTWMRPDGTEKTIKDVNDIAQYVKDTKAEEKISNALYNEISTKAERIVVMAARFAGTLEGQKLEQMVEKIVRPMILSIPEEKRVNYTRDLAEALYPNLSKSGAATAYNKWLRVQEKSAAKAAGEAEDKDKLKEVETLGGWYPDDEKENSGYLVDIFYNKKKRRIEFAYAHIKDLANNDRTILQGPYIDLPNKRLIPPLFDENIDSGAVKLPSGLGEKLNTHELIKRNSDFYRKYFYLEDKSRYTFFGAWALSSWVFDSFEQSVFLHFRGGSGSGKSDLAYLVGITSYRFAVTLSISSSASYKGIRKVYQSVVMIDEVDNMMKKDDGTMAAFLKGSAMKRYSVVMNMLETMTPDGKVFIPSSTNVFGMCLLTGYKPFKDDGIENRCMKIDLSQIDSITLDMNDMEPGFYPPELENDAEQLRNLAMRWRLETWKPKIELSDEQRKQFKLMDPTVSPRVNQVLRPMKVLAVLQNDRQMLDDLRLIGQANYEDEMIKRSGSFEAMMLRAYIAAFEKQGYADKIRTGRMGKFGQVKHILYKDLATIMNDMLDVENLADGAEVNKKDRVKSRTVGEICRDTFRFPVGRTGNGWAVAFDAERLEIGKLRFGLNLEDEEQQVSDGLGDVKVIKLPNVYETPNFAPSEQAMFFNEKTGEWE